MTKMPCKDAGHLFFCVSRKKKQAKKRAKKSVQKTCKKQSKKQRDTLSECPLVAMKNNQSTNLDFLAT